MFNSQRFSLLLRRRFELDRRELFVNIAVMSGIAMVILGGSLTMAYYSNGASQENMPLVFSEIQRGMFATFVCISASVFASKMFFEYGEKNNCIASLMLPATMLEKWLAPFLLSTVYFLVTVIAVFFVAQIVNLAVFNAMRPSQIPLGAAAGIFNPGLFLEMLGAFCSVHALYFLGSIHFKDNHWWHTTLVLLAGAVVFGIIQFLFSEAIWPKNVVINDQMGQYFAQIKGDGIYRIPVQQVWQQATGLIAWALPPVFWGLSYLKLTEKEV